jgi:hypothetical protein
MANNSEEGQGSQRAIVPMMMMMMMMMMQFSLADWLTPSHHSHAGCLQSFLSKNSGDFFPTDTVTR